MWVILEAIAFVAQTPWIENASVKENIIFGLPCDIRRYANTLSACALIQDLDILPDGDLTDVGLGGINLSGGQKCRISLARAIHSRAGILILDDIFSAVDADVASHILEHALCGELGTGRTRILATHHKDLCISRASYHVEIGHGGILHKSLEKPRAREGFSDFCTHSAGGVTVELHKLSQGSAESEALDLRQSVSQHDGILAKTHDEEDMAVGVKRKTEATKAKKFVEDEEREVGSVKFRTYKGYLNASGGLWILIVVLIMHVGYMASITGRVSSADPNLWKSTYQVECFHRLSNISAHAQAVFAPMTLADLV